MSFKENKEPSLWYKDAIIYQLHVRSFADSDDDGVGDFQGLTERLDYLQDLGVSAIWLLPFYPSPLRDEGYDIADYTNIHPMYGNLDDFRAFLEAAHQRDLRVITELVINHTSDQHPWFQRARRAPPDSPWRNYYVWSDTPERYKETRIIFKDFEYSNWAWDPIARAYYWHRFYAHQPDLNFENPDVQQEVFRVCDFWLNLGVDGLRLDAVPYLYEQEGTNCENLPETHQFLKRLRRHVDANFAGRMLLAEANQWPEDAVAYFGEGDECHMAFHFPVMPRMFIAIRMQDRFPIVETLHHTPPIPENSQWALFLRNHDELTLEMVTAEERSFMYRVYARNPRARINLGIRRRLAPLLQNDRKQIELLNGLLFSMPGTPVIYYGDEIGMGDNIYLGDRDGVRTPMQWSPDRNAGFSRANAQRIFLPVIIDPAYHFEAINVEAQQSNPHSLLRWMKHLIAMRKRHQAFSRGSVQFLAPHNQKVLAFIRQHADEHILVVANLSQSVQCTELDLSAFRGMQPVELFGQTVFPPIGDLPYFLTLGPNAFYWLVLQAARGRSPLAMGPADEQLATITVAQHWSTLFSKGRAQATLTELLPRYLRRQHWFVGKERAIRSVEVVESVPLPYESPSGYMLLTQVEYTEGDTEMYALSFTYAAGETAARLLADYPEMIAAHLHTEETGETGIIYDALENRDFALLLLESIAQHRSFKGTAGEIMAFPVRSFALRAEITSREPPAQASEDKQRLAMDGDSVAERPIATDGAADPPVSISDHSNTTLLYERRFTLKCFRRIEAGVNPDLEIGRFFTERISPARAPLLLGALEYRQKNSEPVTLAVLQTFVANQGTAWQHTQEALRGYIERVLARPAAASLLPVPRQHVLSLARMDVSPLAAELIAPYLEVARLLGQRTAEMHVALAQESDDPGFVPEPFSDFFQRPYYHSMIGLMDRDFQALRQQLEYLPEDVQEDARRVIAHEQDVRRFFQPFRDRKMTGMRIRCHGNYHLRNVLRTDDDFTIIDFDGLATLSLEERRSKASPLRDVSSMLRSFHYATYEALFAQEAQGLIRTADIATRVSWMRFWYVWVSALFLKGYLETIGQSPLLLQTDEEFQVLLDAYLLERTFHELSYELSHRRDWVKIPLRGILQLLASQ